ncbi:MAG: L,D-transpeptidase family protein [Clostridia bacterium]|nr:L,D-transpeptidase family protein [Clostridia bacterium]
MKSKKVYIGIVAILISLGIVIASVFYIKANNKDVEVSQFNKDIVNEETKEAMQETEEVKKENTDEEKTEEESKEEVKKEEPKQEVKKTEKKVEQPKKEFVVTDISKTMYVNVNDSLNVRSGPDTSYSRLGSLKRADEIKITGETGEWYRISYNGRVGYIKACYLSSTKPEPIQQPEPEIYSEPSSGGSTINNLIIINSRNNTLRYYVGGSLRRSYRCATGTSGTPTPQGKFSVFEKLVDRPYYKQNIPGGAPNNPLGPRWMQFKGGGYAIHGTNTESSIGTNASHGCVRMHNSEVIELYDMVPIGTTVIVKNTSESDEQIAAGYGIHIE